MVGPLVSPAELAALESNLDAALTLVDCRFSLADASAGERSYEEGHIPGAVYAHLERDMSGPIVPGKTGRHPLPEAEELAKRLGALGIGNGSLVVTYDESNGAFASRLWWLLRWLGHDDVAVLDGGLARWSAEGRPVTNARTTLVAKEFRATPRPELVADVNAVEAARRDPAARLLDARGADRFRGENETMDPVAGHIPGARSLPFLENLVDGRMRPAADLRARFEQALGGVPTDKAVMYCGSGVTACQNLLAAEHAGLSGMRLFPGSWSEWITDPSRPVALGR